MSAFELSHEAIGTYVAFRDRSGWRNSIIKEPSKRVKGPETTGSSRASALRAITTIS